MSCFNGSCDHGHMVIMNDVIDQYYVEGPTLRTLSVIEKVPPEIFVAICGYLAPLWLYNLSHVCSTTFNRLRGQEGNQIWYNVLPVSVWKEAEMFQDEEELLEWANPPGRAHTTLSVITRSMNRKFSCFSKIPLPTQSSTMKQRMSVVMHSAIQPPTVINTPTFPTLGYQAFPVHANQMIPPPNANTTTLNGWADRRGIGYDLSPIKAEFPSLFSMPLAAGRKKVAALGGPYQPLFNYKREILGYLKTLKRCFLCLSIKTSLDSSVTCWKWGILWCSYCIAEYSIASTVLEEIFNGQLIMESTRLQAFRQARRDMYYRPEIDDLVRGQFEIDLRTLLKAEYEAKQVAAKRRLERSRLEVNRRLVRNKLVQVAKLLWEGVDPNPDVYFSAEGVVSYHARPNTVSGETFRPFRERFAPTSELEKFLFPDYHLVDKPSQTEHKPEAGWLWDPTNLVEKSMRADQISEQWYCDQAAGMLLSLTNSRERNYMLKGYGGYVDIWIKACTQYHLKRLEAEIESGATVSMANTPVDVQHSRNYDRIRKLRAKCGLQKEGYGMMTPLPQRVDVNDFSSHYSFDQYLEMNRVAAAAEDDRKTKIKAFNKIVRHTCVGCPITVGLFYPMGLEGLLEHMRAAHPHEFWDTDDFHVIG